MKWATRPGVHVDRAACAWLIRRFIDPGPEFVFAGDLAAVPADATPFDMRGAGLGHHQGRCSFETALASFDLTTDARPLSQSEVSANIRSPPRTAAGSSGRASPNPGC
jgi:hypothetical protein